MIKYILIAGCVCFSMLGLAEFLHGVKTKLIASGKKGTIYAVVFLSDGNPEDQIAFAAEQRIWLGKSYADGIIAVNCGLSESADKLCREAAEKYGVAYCSAEELENFMPL